MYSSIYFIVGLICNALIRLMKLSTFPNAYWPFVNLLWRNVYLDSLSIFLKQLKQQDTVSVVSQLLHSYYLTVSVGQEWRSSFSRSYGSGSYRLQSRCQPVLWSHLNAWLRSDPIPTSVFWLLAEFSISWVFGLRASVSCSLLPRKHSQFLAI